MTNDGAYTYGVHIYGGIHDDITHSVGFNSDETLLHSSMDGNMITIPKNEKDHTTATMAMLSSNTEVGMMYDHGHSADADGTSVSLSEYKDVYNQFDIIGDSSSTIIVGKDQDFMSRHLNQQDCSTFLDTCNFSGDPFGRPSILKTGTAFKELIANCIDGTGICASTYDYPSTPIGCWNTSYVQNMNEAFKNQVNFNKPINCWDVSRVTTMQGMFFTTQGMFSASKFNQPIQDWNVSSVTDMGFMFQGATDFNQQINSWNVSSVTDMIGMFYGAKRFDKSIEDWDVASVTKMNYMFLTAEDFNQQLERWNVSKVETMSAMFQQAINFNQPLEQWNFRGVTNMYNMFFFASSFKQCLGSW